MTHEFLWNDERLKSAQFLIKSAWESPEQRSNPEVLQAVEDTMAALDQGILRTASPGVHGEWEVHEWVKMAVLLYFPAHSSRVLEAGDLAFFDKVPINLLCRLGHPSCSSSGYSIQCIRGKRLHCDALVH